MTHTREAYVHEGDRPVADGTLSVNVDLSSLCPAHLEAVTPEAFADYIRGVVNRTQFELRVFEPEAAPSTDSVYYTERYIVLQDRCSLILRVTFTLPMEADMIDRGILIEDAVTKSVRWLLQTLKAKGSHQG
ncbi:MAG TPA: hypothetical protein VFZ62_03270 [Candidatus Saccharimonadales bacterium]